MNASRAEWHEEALKERLCWRLAEAGPEKIRVGLYWPRGGGVLPYMGYIGMCRCEGYGFQAVFSEIGFINQRV